MPVTDYPYGDGFVPRRIQQILSAWVPFILWMVVIYWGSSKSILPEPASFETIPDDLVHYPAHVFEFAVLAFLAWRAFRGVDVTWAASPGVSSLPQAGVFSALYAAGDEVHQWFVPGREASVLDWVADVFGISLAIAVVLWRGRQARGVEE